MAKRALILGGGFGGIAAAHALRKHLNDDDEVLLIDRDTHFFMGFRKTAAIIGSAPLEDGMRALADLKRFGIEVRRDEITGIDPGARRVTLGGGDTIEADAILVALGAETRPAAVPGLAEHGINWYAASGTGSARDALQREKGHVLIAIFGAPYKCPPAPFELALLANEAARDAGRKLTFEVTSPLPSSLPVVGPTGCQAIEGRIAGQMIGWRPNTALNAVEEGAALTQGGERIPFDVLLAVPPHRVPDVVTQAGLAPEGGWIKVDPPTLATQHEGIWAVGDCVAIPMGDGKPMPKAGEFAAGAGEVAAAHMAAFLTGGTTDSRYWGDGACFLEAGNGEAMLVRGRFLTEGGPQVELTTPSKEHLEAKATFERDRLDAWFGTN